VQRKKSNLLFLKNIMDFDVNRVLIIHYENIFKIFKNMVLEGESTLYYK